MNDTPSTTIFPVVESLLFVIPEIEDIPSQHDGTEQND